MTLQESGFLVAKNNASTSAARFKMTDIHIFDNLLVALDAPVGEAVFRDVLKPANGKTHILLTHALHFLPEVYYLIVLTNNGRIAERGTYAKLMQAWGAFSDSIEEFGSAKAEARCRGCH